MSTVQTSRSTATTPSGNSLAGTGTLIRFALRRDRIRIPVWLAALTFGTVSTAQSFDGLYATQADRQSIAQTMNSPAGLAMTGPSRYLQDYNFGSMLSHQMLGFTTLLVGLMSVLLLVRHTRAEEESGRAELVRAAVVGRHAHLTAALAVVAAANIALAALLAVSLGSLDMAGITWSGSWLFGAAHAMVGLVFAGIAAITAQITEHTRGATGLGMAAIGLAYVLRASGDVGNEVASWLSPIGWAQRTWAYLDNQWWPVLLGLAFAVVLIAAGYRLSVQRDVGAGLRQTRPGRGTASTALATPLGLALRLHRGLLIGFGFAMLLLGVAYGSVIGDAEEMLGGSEVLKDALASMGGASITESFASTVLSVLAIIASVYTVLASSRARAEETAGRAEPVLATPVSRLRWLASHLTVVLLGSVLMAALAGLGFGITAANSTGDSGLLWELFGGSLAYIPALWVAAGVATTLFGLLPRLTALAWIVPVYGFVVVYLGQILQFPQWMNNLSPFGHVPRVPASELEIVPLLILAAVAAALTVAGMTGFRDRGINAV